MNQNPSKATKARTVVASLLFVEASIVMCLGVWLIWLTISAQSFEILPLLGVLLFVLLTSIGLAWCAIGYRRGKYFGRSPSVAANLIALGVVYYQFQAHLWFIAIPLAFLTLATLVSVLRAIPSSS